MAQTEKPTRWVEPFFVHTYDVNHLGVATPVTLLRMMQEAASRHAETLEFGYDHLRSKGLFWVLSRLQVKIHRYPMWGEELYLETWPSGIHSLLANRDFRATDDGGVAAEATSSWIVLKADDRRPVRPATALKRLAEATMGELLFHGPAERVEIPDAPEGSGWHDSPSFPVRVSALDNQGHVNNAKYLEWCLDAFSKEHFDRWEVRSASMNFLAESHYGAKLRVRTAELDESSESGPLTTVQAVDIVGTESDGISSAGGDETNGNSGEERPAFAVKIVWEER